MICQIKKVQNNNPNLVQKPKKILKKSNFNQLFHPKIARVSQELNKKRVAKEFLT